MLRRWQNVIEINGLVVARIGEVIVTEMGKLRVKFKKGIFGKDQCEYTAPKMS